MTTIAITRAADNDDNKFDGDSTPGDDGGNSVTTMMTMRTTAMMATARWASM